MNENDSQIPPLNPEQLRWSREGSQDWEALKAKEEELRAYESRLKSIDAWEAQLKDREQELLLKSDRPIVSQTSVMAQPVGPQAVIITGLEISFTNLVRNLILLALAAIPALIILILFGQLLFGWLLAKGLSVLFH